MPVALIAECVLCTDIERGVTFNVLAVVRVDGLFLLTPVSPEHPLAVAPFYVRSIEQNKNNDDNNNNESFFFSQSPLPGGSSNNNNTNNSALKKHSWLEVPLFQQKSSSSKLMKILCMTGPQQKRELEFDEVKYEHKDYLSSAYTPSNNTSASSTANTANNNNNLVSTQWRLVRHVDLATLVSIHWTMGSMNNNDNNNSNSTSTKSPFAPLCLSLWFRMLQKGNVCPLQNIELAPTPYNLFSSSNNSNLLKSNNNNSNSNGNEDVLAEALRIRNPTEYVLNFGLNGICRAIELVCYLYKPNVRLPVLLAYASRVGEDESDDDEDENAENANDDNKNTKLPPSTKPTTPSKKYKTKPISSTSSPAYDATFGSILAHALRPRKFNTNTSNNNNNNNNISTNGGAIRPSAPTDLLPQNHSTLTTAFISKSKCPTPALWRETKDSWLERCRAVADVSGSDSAKLLELSALTNAAKVPLTLAMWDKANTVGIPSPVNASALFDSRALVRLQQFIIASAALLEKSRTAALMMPINVNGKAVESVLQRVKEYLIHVCLQCPAPAFQNASCLEEGNGRNSSELPFSYPSLSSSLTGIRLDSDGNIRFPENLSQLQKQQLMQPIKKNNNAAAAAAPPQTSTSVSNTVVCGSFMISPLGICFSPPITPTSAALQEFEEISRSNNNNNNNNSKNENGKPQMNYVFLPLTSLVEVVGFKDEIIVSDSTSSSASSSSPQNKNNSKSSSPNSKTFEENNSLTRREGTPINNTNNPQQIMQNLHGNAYGPSNSSSTSRWRNVVIFRFADPVSGHIQNYCLLLNRDDDDALVSSTTSSGNNKSSTNGSDKNSSDGRSPSALSATENADGGNELNTTQLRSGSSSIARRREEQLLQQDPFYVVASQVNISQLYSKKPPHIFRILNKLCARVGVSLAVTSIAVPSPLTVLTNLMSSTFFQALIVSSSSSPLGGNSSMANNNASFAPSNISFAPPSSFGGGSSFASPVLTSSQKSLLVQRAMELLSSYPFKAQNLVVQELIGASSIKSILNNNNNNTSNTSSPLSSSVLSTPFTPTISNNNNHRNSNSSPAWSLSSELPAPSALSAFATHRTIFIRICERKSRFGFWNERAIVILVDRKTPSVLLMQKSNERQDAFPTSSASPSDQNPQQLSEDEIASTRLLIVDLSTNQVTDNIGARDVVAVTVSSDRRPPAIREALWFPEGISLNYIKRDANSKTGGTSTAKNNEDLAIEDFDESDAATPKKMQAGDKDKLFTLREVTKERMLQLYGPCSYQKPWPRLSTLNDVFAFIKDPNRYYKRRAASRITASMILENNNNNNANDENEDEESGKNSSSKKRKNCFIVSGPPMRHDPRLLDFAPRAFNFFASVGSTRLVRLIEVRKADDGMWKERVLVVAANYNNPRSISTVCPVNERPLNYSVFVCALNGTVEVLLDAASAAASCASNNNTKTPNLQVKNAALTGTGANRKSPAKQVMEWHTSGLALTVINLNHKKKKDETKVAKQNNNENDDAEDEEEEEHDDESSHNIEIILREVGAQRMLAVYGQPTVANLWPRLWRVSEMCEWISPEEEEDRLLKEEKKKLKQEKDVDDNINDGDDQKQDKETEISPRQAPKRTLDGQLVSRTAKQKVQNAVRAMKMFGILGKKIGISAEEEEKLRRAAELETIKKQKDEENAAITETFLSKIKEQEERRQKESDEIATRRQEELNRQQTEKDLLQQRLQEAEKKLQTQEEKFRDSNTDMLQKFIQLQSRMSEVESAAREERVQAEVVKIRQRALFSCQEQESMNRRLLQDDVQTESFTKIQELFDELITFPMMRERAIRGHQNQTERKITDRDLGGEEESPHEQQQQQQQQGRNEFDNTDETTDALLVLQNNNARQQQLEELLLSQEGKWRESNSDMLSRFLEQQQRMAEIENNNNSVALQVAAEMRVSAMNACQDQERFLRTMIDQSQEESLDRVEELFLSTMPPKDRRFLTSGVIALTKMENETEADARRALENVEVLQRRKLCISTILVGDSFFSSIDGDEKNWNNSGLEALHRFLEVERREEIEYLEQIQEIFASKVIGIQKDEEFSVLFDFALFQEEKESILHREAEKRKLEYESATKIQSKIRQNQAKSELEKLRREAEEKAEREKSARENKAATVIQCKTRQILAKNELRSLQEKDIEIKDESSSRQNLQDDEAQEFIVAISDRFEILSNIIEHKDALIQKEQNRRLENEQERVSSIFGPEFTRDVLLPETEESEAILRDEENKKEFDAALQLQNEIAQELDELRQREKTQQENSAATTIQSKVRQAQAKTKVDQLRQEKKQLDNAAATKIQSKIRQAQAKKQVSKMRHERDAAVTIQSKVRQNIAKAKANELREEQQKNKNESSAATKIQAKVRQNQAKNEANRLRDELKQRAQLQQQEELERNENFENAEQLDRNLLLQQHLVESEETERDNISASQQQHQQEMHAQTLRAVSNLNHREDEEASRQAIHEEETDSFDNFRRQFNEQESEITEAEKENSAATTIQSKIRQAQAKTRVDHLRQEKKQLDNAAATKIQSKIRQAQAKKQVSKMRHERDAAVTIQSKVRQNIAKAKANELREEQQKNKNESSAATKIQAKVRQNQAKNELQRLRNLKEAADNDELDNRRQQLESELLSRLQREEQDKKFVQELQAEECRIRVTKIESDEIAVRLQDLVLTSQLFVFQIDEDDARRKFLRIDQPLELLNLKIAEIVLIDEPMMREEISVDQAESTWWMGQVKYPFIDDENVTVIHGMQQSKDLRRLGEMLERIRQMNQVSFTLLDAMNDPRGGSNNAHQEEFEKAAETKNDQVEPFKSENNNNDDCEEKDENEDSRKEAIVVQILQQQFELQDEENDRRSGIDGEQESSSTETLEKKHQELFLFHRQLQEIIIRNAAEKKLQEMTDDLKQQEEYIRDSIGLDEEGRMRREIEEQAEISKLDAVNKEKTRTENEAQEAELRRKRQEKFHEELRQTELEETQTRQHFIGELETSQWNELFEDECNLRKEILKKQDHRVDTPTKNILPPLQITSPRAKPKSLSNTITNDSSLTTSTSNNNNSDSSPLSSARRKKIKQQQQQLLLTNSNSQFLNMTTTNDNEDCEDDKNVESEDSLARTKRQQLLEKQKRFNNDNKNNNSHEDDDDDNVDFENYDHESFESAKRREKKLVVRGPQVALGLYPTSLFYNDDDASNKNNSGPKRSSSVPRNSPKGNNDDLDRFSRTKTAFTGYYSSDFNYDNNDNNNDNNNNNNINNADHDHEQERGSGANPNLIRRDKGYEPMSEWELEEERRMFDAFARVQQVLDFGRTGQYVIPEKWIREGRAKRSGSTLYGAYVFADFSKSTNKIDRNNIRKQAAENIIQEDTAAKTISPNEFISRTPRTTSSAAATRIAHVPRKSIKDDILDMKNDVRRQDEYLEAVAQYNENNKNNFEENEQEDCSDNNNDNSPRTPNATTKTPTVAVSEDEERRFKTAQDKMDKRVRAALAAEKVRQRKLERQQQLGSIEFDLEVRARNFVFAAEEDAREELQNTISKGKKILQVRLALMMKRQQQQQQLEVAEVESTTQTPHQNCNDSIHLVETPKSSPDRNNNSSNNNDDGNDECENNNVDPLSRYVQHVMSRKRSLTQDGPVGNKSRTANTTDASETDAEWTTTNLHLSDMIEFQEFECVLRIRLACDGLIDVTALALEAEKDLEVIEVLEARKQWLLKLEVRRDIMMPKVNFNHLMTMNAAVGSPKNRNNDNNYNVGDGNRSNNSGSRDRNSPSK